MKKILHVFLFFLTVGFFSSIFSPQALAFSGIGTGTSTDPYQVTTCSQIQEVQNSLSAYYMQENNIDCTGVDFAPIGTDQLQIAIFKGTYDGGDHTISNLVINRATNVQANAYVGIFGIIDTTGVVKNLGYQSGSVAGYVIVGSIAGYNKGTISNTFSSVTISAADTSPFDNPYVGGLVGFNHGTINDSYATGNITASSSFRASAGGFIGYADNGSITRSYATGSVSGGSKMGGFVGNLASGPTISNSFATGSVGSGSTIGGFGGSVADASSFSNIYWNNTGSPSNCYSGGDTNCSAISNNASYFYIITNAPMNTWDFVNVWSKQNNGSNYPILLWQATPVSTTSGSSSESVSTTSSSSCGSAAPSNAPNLFQLKAIGSSVKLYFAPVSGANNKYAISYGPTASADSFAAMFDYSDTSGVIPYTVNDLYPGTWYFKVRGQNGCMPGNWSQIVSVIVGSSQSTQVNSSTTVLGAMTQKQGGCIDYTVTSGDSLWSIATEHLGNGVSYPMLLQQNSLHSTFLTPGQKLKINC